MWDRMAKGIVITDRKSATYVETPRQRLRIEGSALSSVTSPVKRVVVKIITYSRNPSQRPIHNLL
jgi:hypothetical protein